jgi:molybdopterin synthase sulfur carrier subunit
MVTIEFLGPIGKEPMELEVKSLQELKEQLHEDPALDQWLANSSVAVNDELVNDMNTLLNDGDKVVLLPPVCGG